MANIQLRFGLPPYVHTNEIERKNAPMKHKTDQDSNNKCRFWVKKNKMDLAIRQKRLILRQVK
jgi:hypothetical protein